jgi:large subunit ribosomal protein L29
MIKPSDLRDMTVEEIEQRLREIEQEFFNLKFRRAVQQIENPLRIRSLRRDLARIKTVLNEHRLRIREIQATSDKTGSKE